MQEPGGTVQRSDTVLTPDEKEQVLKALDWVTKMVRGINPETPCVQCDSFQAGYCQTHKQKIPVAWLGKGCEQWSNQVPF